jgi:peptide/nickel transport system ATP-binding protein
VVGYLADHIAVMNRGLIEESGAATTLLRSPQADFTRTLLAAVPRIETVFAP